ncbi:RNA polymerase factor sigma-54 [Pseudorhodoferax soli]|uniref:RNA polymerase sigma-54 factor n=1 Tax=Pseudorhodoferax soli TaxID=545864 RepID=A0A368XZB9_9BURK|nr:RNA polymerase factor sigma-54 [Pseudorhodoferax soli]RCW72496.1 RNA polymerase RpoN-/SigL-like sigma 54 subunit [Pseudorhodoferax soli]
MLQPALQHQAQPQFSVRQQRAVQLLQMPNLEFAASIDACLASNPFLEIDEQAPPPAAAAMDEAQAVSAAGQPWGATLGARQRPRGGDGDFDALAFLPAPVSLRDHLHAQLRLLRLDDRSFMLASLLCEALDEDGYLRLDPTEVAALGELQPAAGVAELDAALACVQTLDPPGVGARSLVECLQLQLASHPDAQERQLCTRLLTEAEPALRTGDVARCARLLGCSAATVQRLLRLLRGLDPHPGWRHGGEPVRYVVPDVLARRTRTGWTAQLNEAVVPRVQLHRAYAELYRQHRGTAAPALAGQLQEARWTLRNVEQRFSTILAVAQSIVRRQQRFLDHGPLAMQPLVLRQVAEELGMHESTVSRVTHQKFIATPSGTFELGYFFSRGLSVVGGGQCSPTAVRELVHEIIVREKGAPLSDVAIALQLARRGIRVARRTVTKYRQQLGLGTAGLRAARGMAQGAST